MHNAYNISGQYFDTTLNTLARWPPGKLQSFAFVQDPPPDLSQAGASEEDDDFKFAQPIVLHRTTCISNFVSSQLARSLRHFRLRIPSRSVTAALTSDATSSVVLPGPSTKILPRLELLDISTTYLQQGPGFKAFLARHHGLHHLILDRTGLLSFPHDASALGKAVAAVGLTRAAEAHKAWRVLSHRKSEAIAAAQRHRQGRDRSDIHLYSAFAALALSPDRPSELDNIPSKMIILPPVNTYHSICYGIDVPSSERPEWQEAWQAGYQAGLDAVRENLDGKLGQLRRAEAKREMRPDGDGCFMRFCTQAERQELQAADIGKIRDPFELYCHTFGLIPATQQDVSTLNAQLIESSCVFCIIPDCAAVGGVAVSPLIFLGLFLYLWLTLLHSGHSTILKMSGIHHQPPSTRQAADTCMRDRFGVSRHVQSNSKWICDIFLGRM